MQFPGPRAQNCEEGEPAKEPEDAAGVAGRNPEEYLLGAKEEDVLIKRQVVINFTKSC